MKKALTNLITGAGIALTALGCGPELKQNVDVCKGALPAKYEQYLEDNQNVASSLIWDGSTKLQYAEDCQALEDLAEHLDGRIEMVEPPEPTEVNEVEQASYDEQTARDMYLSHIAHSLLLEVENSLPWKMSEHDRETLRLLLDGRNFIVKKDGLYTFEHVPSNASFKITDWSPKPAFDFMVENDMIEETELDTLYSITEWMTENLRHVGEGTPENWDDYEGSPPIDKILNPPDGTHWIWGCWGTTSLYIAMLRTLNIPVERGYTYFAKSANRNNNEWHSRPEFPTLGIALIHGDDVYNKKFKGDYNRVPAERIFVTLDELKELIDNPKRVKEDGYKPTKPEMALFNSYKRSMGLAAEYRSDWLMFLRAYEVLGGVYIFGTLDDAFIGKDYNGETMQPLFWKPVFNSQEREQMIKGIDEALKELGNGNLEDGCYKALPFGM